MKRLIVGLQIIAFLTYLVACSSSESAAIQTPTIILTSAIIPVATSTSEPTITATPTSKPTQTPLSLSTAACPPQPNSQATLNSIQEKTSALVPGAKVIWYDNFDCQDLNYGWGAAGQNPTTKISVSKGILTFSAQKVEEIWDGLGRAYNLGDQKGFLVLFRYQANTTANLFFHTGTWQTSDYRRWGLSIGDWSVVDVSGDGLWVGWHGTNWLHSYFPSRVLQPNKWYYLLARLDKSGGVTMNVWEKDDPINQTDFQMEMPSNWIGHHWQFLMQVYEGTLEIDEYQELSFEAP